MKCTVHGYFLWHIDLQNSGEVKHTVITVVTDSLSVSSLAELVTFYCLDKAIKLKIFFTSMCVCQTYTTFHLLIIKMMGVTHILQNN